MRLPYLPVVPQPAQIMVSLALKFDWTAPGYMRSLLPHLLQDSEIVSVMVNLRWEKVAMSKPNRIRLGVTVPMEVVGD